MALENGATAAAVVAHMTGFKAKRLPKFDT
jgi:hypothetical protein